VKMLTAAKYLSLESWHVDGRVWILSAAAEACLNSMTHAVVADNEYQHAAKTGLAVR
jgi:hypothetical protein